MRWCFLVLMIACSHPAPVHTEPVPVPRPIDASPVDAVPDAPPPPPIDAPTVVVVDAEPFDCAEPCTLYAVCYERHWKVDYRKGGECTYQCEKMSPEGQRQFAKDVEVAMTSKKKCKELAED